MLLNNNKIKFIMCFFATLVIIIFSQQIVLCDNTIENNKSLQDWSKQLVELSFDSKSFLINESIKLIFSTDKTDNINGYILVDTYDQNNTTIIEYGFGIDIPYTEVNKNLVYISPLENYYLSQYETENIYIEGFSNEWLPDLSGLTFTKNNCDSISTNEQIIDSYINNKLCFNPFHNLDWLVNKQSKQNMSINEIKSSLRNDKKILFSGYTYGNKVHFAYSIIGYHEYVNHIYLALYDFDTEMIRFVSYEDIHNYGNFNLYH